jgi:membrane protein
MQEVRTITPMLSTRFIRFLGYLSPITIKRVVESAGQQRLPGLAAEMAYNAMLGLFPGILTILTAIGLFQPLKTTFQALAGQLSEVAPEEASRLIQDFAAEISTSRNSGLFSLSFAIALWASSGALSAAMTALDHIHRVPPREMRPFWKAKLISLGLTIGTILLLMLACMLVFVSELVIHHVANQSGALKPGLLMVWRLLAWPLALGIVSVAFAFVYRFGPSRWITDKPILPGAIIAAISWAIVSGLFRQYVAHFGNYNKAYGAVGAVIVLLLWLYLSSLILLIGDQLNVTVGEAMQIRARQQASSQPTASDTRTRRLRSRTK